MSPGRRDWPAATKAAMRQVAQTIGSLVQLDSAAKVLAGALRALPEGCSSDAVRAEPAVADAVKAAARAVGAFRLPLGEVLSTAGEY